METLKNPRVLSYLGTAPRAEEFDGLVDAFQSVLPTSVRREALYDSLTHLAGRELTLDALRDTIWRLAGNVRRLRSGQAVTPWSRQPLDEIVPAQIVRYAPERNQYARVGGRYHFRVLAGTSCPMVISTFWTQTQCRMVARRVGFTSAKKKFPFQHPAQLFGMRMYLHIEAELSVKQPTFAGIDVGSSMADWNRTLLKQRLRIDFTCPHDFTHPCHNCPVGVDECDAAVHLRTYTHKTCARCNASSLFDPEYPKSRLCVNCASYLATHGSEEHV